MFILIIMIVDCYVIIVYFFRYIGLSVCGMYVVLFVMWFVVFILVGIFVIGIEYYKEFYVCLGVCFLL